ncbi:splicing factor, putative [Theileria annulata]|uniref:Splicing factor, putative n=1 Tax=Theileria annulata TaxID=5874 RepID=Q4UHC8_THEAN|nr:splicing factor, putative [Theileria annulata]CAI73511.1 splicing factor, putative [Theileria annulata]|eukprot:XP_954188.1 splicing factor, putative [Theileria annulata]
MSSDFSRPDNPALVANPEGSYRENNDREHLSHREYRDDHRDGRRDYHRHSRRRSYPRSHGYRGDYERYRHKRSRSRSRDRYRSRSRDRYRDRDDRYDDYNRDGDKTEKGEEENLLLNRDISESHARSRAAERRRRKAQAECIRRAGGFQKLADQEGHQTVRLFWDGFQWVAKTEQTTILGGDPALMNSTRKLRRLYFGNLPVHTGLTETGFQNLIWNEMRNRNFCNDPNVSPVLYVWFAKDKGNYGFVEFASVEETERALTMDGMTCMGVQLRVSRPNDYSSTSMKTATQQQIVVPQLSTSSTTLPANFSGRYLHLVQIVLPETVEAEVEYLDVLDDVKEEFGKHGKIKSALIIAPRHKEMAKDFQAGDMMIEFEDEDSLLSCVQNMSNRKYENRLIQMKPLEEDVYSQLSEVIIPDLEQMDKSS